MIQPIFHGLCLLASEPPSDSSNQSKRVMRFVLEAPAETCVRRGQRYPRRIRHHYLRYPDGREVEKRGRNDTTDTTRMQREQSSEVEMENVKEEQ